MLRANHQLSPHFSYFELTRTDQEGLQEKNRDVPDTLYMAGMALAWGILEPIRRKFGRTSISSGYRCPEVNLAVGGSPTSQHQAFEAADIYKVENGSLEDLFHWIRQSALPFGEVILEPAAVHVSLGRPFRDAPQEVLVQVGNEYKPLDEMA